MDFNLFGELKMYVLTYEQPYEYDDDSLGGIGDHEIRWREDKKNFKAQNHDDSRRLVVRFLLDAKYAVQLLDKEVTYRKFKSLKYEEDIGLRHEYESLLKMKGSFL